MTARSGKVLVLGNDTRSFLSVIRSLGRRGLAVHVGWSDADAPALRSRYVVKAHQIPPYSARAQHWKQALRDLLEREAFDLVIPCEDARIIPLQANRPELEQLARIYLLNDRAFEITSSKQQSTELAESLGIPVPRGGLVRSVAEAEALLGRLAPPIFLKPLVSVSGEDTLQRDWVRRVSSPQEAVSHLEEMLARGHVLVQENFSGQGAGVEILAKAGKVLAAFQHLRIHEPPHGGSSSYRRGVPLDPRLLYATRKLVEALDYTGVGMFEFKIDPRSGEWVFMEVNGRFWGSLPLALASGADFPWYLYQMLVLGEESFPSRFSTGVYCRNLVLDIDWFRRNWKADRRDPTLNRVPLRQMLGELKNIILLRERSDTFALDDLAPGLEDLRQGMRFMWKGLLREIQPRLLSLPGLRWWVGRRARSAMVAARSALFVCRGNICRSPFAERLTRSVLGERLKVSSAGFFPKEGRASPGNAVQAASKLGVDLSGHRSRVVTAQDVAQADAIFIFDAINRSEMLKAFPHARGKIHFIGALDSRGPLTIPDPWGCGVETFSEVYQQIAGTLRRQYATPNAAEKTAKSSSRVTLS
jgi:protein-tyrosine-phosphatase/predicted ATP-grasp superfamily ATP-dependent carboligase